MLYHVASTDSTNAWCRRQADSLCDGDGVWADEQTAGRGRLGRTWACAAGQALYLSLFYTRPMVQPSCLPLAVSVGVYRALQETGVRDLCLKWPNDLLAGGKKLVGILCEGVFEGEKARGYICGIGVNLAQPPSFFEERGLVHASSLVQMGGRPESPETMAENIVRHMENILPRFCEEGFSALREEYKAACINLERPVYTDTHRGIAEDIDGEGRLVLRTGDGTKTVFTGEVSVHGIYGCV